MLFAKAAVKSAVGLVPHHYHSVGTLAAANFTTVALARGLVASSNTVGLLYVTIGPGTETRFEEQI